MHGSGRDGRHRVQQQIGWRLATERDVRDYYGRLPSETLRAAVITLDGEVAGIIGVARSAYSARFFSEHKPELEPYLSSVAVWRAVKAALRFVDESQTVVYVVSSDERMMRRLGFQRVPGIEGIWQN